MVHKKYGAEEVVVGNRSGGPGRSSLGLSLLAHPRLGHQRAHRLRERLHQGGDQKRTPGRPPSRARGGRPGSVTSPFRNGTISNNLINTERSRVGIDFHGPVYSSRMANNTITGTPSYRYPQPANLRLAPDGGPSVRSGHDARERKRGRHDAPSRCRGGFLQFRGGQQREVGLVLQHHTVHNVPWHSGVPLR
jgi:hypothetical protein